MCVKIGGGKAIIKAGRPGPHPIQRRGQRLGGLNFFVGKFGPSGDRGNFSENCKQKNILHCHQEMWGKKHKWGDKFQILCLKVCTSDTFYVYFRGWISCTVVDLRAGVITCLVVSGGNLPALETKIGSSAVSVCVFSSKSNNHVFVLLFFQIRSGSLITVVGWVRLLSFLPPCNNSKKSTDYKI